MKFLIVHPKFLHWHGFNKNTVTIGYLKGGDVWVSTFIGRSAFYLVVPENEMVYGVYIQHPRVKQSKYVLFNQDIAIIPAFIPAGSIDP